MSQLTADPCGSPGLAENLLSSGIAAGGITAIVLNLVPPEGVILMRYGRASAGTSDSTCPSRK